MDSEAWGPCEACWRLDADASDKTIAYCGFCDAWLCADCRASWWRRVRAALA
jgi:hypothetical protein